MHESEKWKWSRSVLSDSSDPMDCSLPGSSVHGIFQAKVLEWAAIAFSDPRPQATAKHLLFRQSPTEWNLGFMLRVMGWNFFPLHPRLYYSANISSYMWLKKEVVTSISFTHISRIWSTLQFGLPTPALESYENGWWKIISKIKPSEISTHRQ